MCKVHHFADDANLLYLTNSIKKLKKLINTDLKNLSNWLNANKISLNVKKTNYLNLEGKNVKVLLNLNLIQNRQRLHSSNNIKYLGIKIDENLNWKYINEVSTKLIRVNAILFKIRNYVNPKIFKVHLFCNFQISHNKLLFYTIFSVQNHGSIKCLIIL